MFRFLLPLIIILTYTNTVFAQCSYNTIAGAKYKITTTKPESKTQIKQMNLWRNENQVAHQYSDSHITELWELTSNGRVRLVRYFEQHQRGIEYQPDEIKIKNKINTWERKQQLIANAQLKTMQLQSTQGEDCNKLENYSLTNDHKSITLQWLPYQRLVKLYQVQSEHQTITWELQQITSEKDKVTKVLATLSEYQTTDYADIGDNESDPFFTKMINLGFVEHGSSGFYDAQGNRLQGHHH